MVPYLLPAVALALLLLFWFREHRRELAFKAVAKELSFVFIGEAIPPRVSFRGTPVEYARSIRNVIDGERNGIRTLAFDFTTGEGRQRREHTALVSQSEEDAFDVKRYGGELTTYQTDGWSIAIGRRLAVEEIKAYLAV